MKGSLIQQNENRTVWATIKHKPCKNVGKFHRKQQKITIHSAHCLFSGMFLFSCTRDKIAHTFLFVSVHKWVWISLLFILLLLSMCVWLHASTTFGSGAIVLSRRKDSPTGCPLHKYTQHAHNSRDTYDFCCVICFVFFVFGFCFRNCVCEKKNKIFIRFLFFFFRMVRSVDKNETVWSSQWWRGTRDRERARKKKKKKKERHNQKIKWNYWRFTDVVEKRVHKQLYSMMNDILIMIVEVMSNGIQCANFLPIFYQISSQGNGRCHSSEYVSLMHDLTNTSIASFRWHFCTQKERLTHLAFFWGKFTSIITKLGHPINIANTIM